MCVYSDFSFAEIDIKKLQRALQITTSLLMIPALQGFGAAHGSIDESYFNGDCLLQNNEEASSWQNPGAIATDSAEEFFTSTLLEERHSMSRDGAHAFGSCWNVA